MSRVDEIITAIEGMTVLEINELVKAMQDRWGVSAAPAFVAGAMGGAPAGNGAGAATEEKVEFDVVLANAGAQKIQVIKAVREVVPNLGLKEAKDLVEGAPSKVREAVTKEEASTIKEKLEAAGATVEIK